MLQFLKGNSCLLAFDSHPAFQTGEKLGLFFADFVQDFELSVSPARTQSRQIGSQNYGVDSINFAPDVIANLSFVTKSDFNNENLLGTIFRPHGSFVSPFSGIRDYSFNTYLFFSQEQGYDLAKQILDSNSFSGVGVVALGNCYLANGSFSFSAGNLPRTACSFLASNLVSEILSGNSMTIPAINLENGNTGGAAEILLDPAQVARRETGNLSGILPTWQSLFRPSFEDLQIPSQSLVSANVNSLELSFSIDRENVYGFGSDYVRERDVKFPIQASLSINGVVNDYISGNFPDLMVDESKYMVEIYNRDPQDAVLSGLSISELTGLSPYQHITKNRWLKFENCALRESTNKVSPNQLMEYSASFDVEVTENGGFLFKQGEEESIDDMNLHSSDFHRVVSRDGFSPTHYPFLQYFEGDCSLANLLSSDKQILMTPDNFIEGWMNPTCSVFTYPSGIFAQYLSLDGSLNSFSPFAYPSSGESGVPLRSGVKVFYSYSPSFGVGFPNTEFFDTTATGDFPNAYYKLGSHKAQYSGGYGLYNITYNFEEETPLSPPQITGSGIFGFTIPIRFTTGNHHIVEFYKSADGTGSFTGLAIRTLSSSVVTDSSVTGQSIYYYMPVGIRGGISTTGSITGYPSRSVLPTGMQFDQGTTTSSGVATLRWGTGMLPVSPYQFNIYRNLSGSSPPSLLGTTTNLFYTDSTLSSPNVYQYRTTITINGFESQTGFSTGVFIRAV